MENRPTVSVICLTYNQEEYVRDCLEGFLSQQTDFPYEVLVYDDASTDSTPEIIKEYAAQFPSIIKPTLYKVNNYSQGLGFVGLYTGIKEAKGKYVAYCEGDDYWTDPFKLQKQVSFLDANPQYAICAHETRIRDDGNRKNDGQLFSDFNNGSFVTMNKETYTFDDALAGNIFHVSSMMYRNQNICLPSWITRISACDMVLFKMLARAGDIHVMRDIMSVYRSHSCSLTNSFKEYSSVINFYELSIKVLRLLNRYWDREYQAKIYPIISRYYIECSLIHIHRKWVNISLMKHYLLLAWCYNKGAALKYSVLGLVKKAKNRNKPLAPAS